MACNHSWGCTVSRAGPGGAPGHVGRVCCGVHRTVQIDELLALGPGMLLQIDELLAPGGQLGGRARQALTLTPRFKLALARRVRGRLALGREHTHTHTPRDWEGAHPHPHPSRHPAAQSCPLN